MEINYTYLAAGACVVIALILLIIILRWIGESRRRKAMFIPQEVLDDFNKVEQRMKDSGGELEPHQILWELGREKHSIIPSERRLDYGNYNKNTASSSGQQPREGVGSRDTETPGTDSRVPSGSIDKQPTSIQPLHDFRDAEDKRRDKPVRRFNPI